MNRILRNVLAVIAGLVVGSLVNMGIIMISGMVIEPPEGADVSTLDGLKKSMHLFEPKHFLFPFLAHALGTLVGAFLAAKISTGNKMRYALIIGFFFLFGGLANTFMLPSPTWFTIVDLVFGYLVMAWLGGKLGGAGKEPETSVS
ncbi:MAG: hypothetical protein K0S12_855 [Bacteroidetes bacterium]|nr:hypothetical protein [Bacteroidota bacterium]